MESRRQEDYGVGSSIVTRLRNQRIERIPDPHLTSRYDLMERSPRLPRSLSPPRRLTGSGLLGRRDYGSEVDAGTGRREGLRLRSRSPTFGDRLPNYEKGSLGRDDLRIRSELPDYVERDYERSPRLPRSLSPPRRLTGSGLLGRRDYGWEVDAGTARCEKLRLRSRSPAFDERLPNYEKGSLSRDDLRIRSELPDYAEREYEVDNGLKHSGIRGNARGEKVLAGGGNQFLSDRRVALHDGRIAQETHRSISKLEPALRSADDVINLPSSSRNTDVWFKDESVLYPDPYLLQNLSAKERYGKAERYTFQSKDLSYSGSTALTKDFSDASELTEFAGTSLHTSREDIMVTYPYRMPLAREGYAGSSIQQMEEFSSFKHQQRPNSETGGDPESSRKDLRGYRQGPFSPSRPEDQGYLYSRPPLENTNYSYPFENLASKRPYIEPENYNERDFVTPDLMEFTKENIRKSAYSHGVHSRSKGSWDHPSFLDQSSSEYFPAKRGRILVHQDGARGERQRKSPHIPYDVGADRHFLNGKGMRPYEVDTYNSLEGSTNMKFGIDEELSTCSARNTTSSKGNNFHVMARKERFEERNDDDIDLFLPKSSDYYHDVHLRATRASDVVEHDGVSISDDWLTECHPDDYAQEHSTKIIKPGKRNLKGRYGPGFSNSCDSYSFKKHRLTKEVQLRGNDDNKLDHYAIDPQELDSVPSSFKSEPMEESEDFKQMVNTYFLAFSKKVNANPSTRKRYKEQGRAGPLFCIVCGQSVSKEFKDTKGLVIHCYMSKKAGLRARHLGLHKAICVLLGWESVLAPDVITPTPHAISISEALSQKEDLILWPPIVVIHYISMLAGCHEAEKAFTKEAVEDFLRGKGFSIGKIKVSPGTTSNNSVMLVKFLNTFSGLQEAEKLHEYFIHDKRGRTDFEQIALLKGKASYFKEGRKQGKKLEEPLLYGYIGIAEDLDKVDYDTKRRCLIRSRKEIQDIANGPL